MTAEPFAKVKMGDNRLKGLWCGSDFVLPATAPGQDQILEIIAGKINAAIDEKLLDYKRRVVEAVKGQTCIGTSDSGFIKIDDAIKAVEGVKL